MRRLLLLLAILLLVAVGVTALGLMLAGDRSPLAGGHTVLVWRLAGDLPEHQTAAELPFGPRHQLTLASAYARLRSARTDPKVRGLAVYIGDASFGLARAEEIRRQLAELRSSGRFVHCYLETAGEGANGTLEYYLATACDSLRLAPAGSVNLLGLHLDSTFLRGTLDKLHVYPDFSHRGDFKSYGETFTRADHSPAAEEALDALLDSTFGVIVDGIGTARGKTAAEVKALIDGAPYAADEALAAGLVDALAYPDEFKAFVEEAAGGSAPRLLSLADYSPRSPPFGAPKIAVLYAVGNIVRGRGGESAFGGDTAVGSDDLGKSLRALADDDAVGAVVLRIDSPGGSALASDLILRDVERLRAKKPVVVSMADVAASGGYYIAARATKIVAEASTITGSIGVVSGKFVTRAFEKDLLGITHDTLDRGANAGLYSSLDVYTPAQSARLDLLMGKVYATFLEHVSQGRRLTLEATTAAAGGRVWTGSDALDRGLVDELGGLDRAIELACEDAGLEGCARPQLVFLPNPPSLLELFENAPDTSGLNVWRLFFPSAPELLAPGPRLELPMPWRRLSRPF